ncbi:MAG: hypothetical protein OEV67_10320 [Betaproteobacteria bacterium]|jgi:hypothetical protein|nr:hypothetical protein [Betaproteobacteria bacterium]
MRTFTSVMMAVAIAAAALSGCTPTVKEKTAVIDDKVYAVAPDQIKVKAGILLGEVTEMTVVERVEQGTGRVDSAAKLRGKLKLTNGSTDQSVRLLNGRVLFIDEQGQPIKLEESRTDSKISFSGSYNSPDRLDPGNEASQDIDVNFPAAALKTAKLREIRLEIEYLPASYRKDTASFNVSISDK